MNGDEQLYLDIALERGYIDPKTAQDIAEELRMFPGMKPGGLLIRKGLLAKDQHAAIVAQLEAPTMQRMRAMGLGGGGGAAEPAAPFESIARAATPQQERTRDEAMRALLTSPLPRPPQNAALSSYLEYARKNGCSDLHISPGRPVFVRHGGTLHYLDHPPLSDEDCEKLCFSVLSEQQREVLRSQHQIDLALAVPIDGRYRCHIFRQQWGYDGVFRVVGNEVPSIEKLGLPAGVTKLTEYHHGLVIVTGPAGSGKTTTVAALLNHINAHRHEHIITVEQPIEYVIPSQSCMVSQREVGQHTENFHTALRAALRQDPDIMFVGDLRDYETTAIAIAAAETGHLVLGTLHTALASRAVARIVDIFPAAMREQICMTVAESMRGVIAQQLVPRRDGSGMALAVEVLIFTPGVAQAVKEQKSHQLLTLMQGGRRLGMQLMDDSLMALVQGGIISGRDAQSRAANKAVFEAVKEK